MIAFNKEPLAFDLLITDLNMPKMMGTDLAKAFLAVRPKLPIILCTGYSDTVDMETVQDLGIECLFKPVEKDILVGLARNLLDEKKDASTKE
jgi:DNA-binding NtrC family response regulator